MNSTHAVSSLKLSENNIEADNEAIECKLTLWTFDLCSFVPCHEFIWVLAIAMLCSLDLASFALKLNRFNLSRNRR